VSVFGDCAGDTGRPFLYALSLRRLPHFLVKAAQPPNIFVILLVSEPGWSYIWRYVHMNFTEKSHLLATVFMYAIVSGTDSGSLVNSVPKEETLKHIVQREY
jgi:hypothetical protein